MIGEGFLAGEGNRQFIRSLEPHPMCTMRINGGSYGGSISVRESVVALPKPALSTLHRPAPLTESSRNSWRVTGPISAATAESPTKEQ